MPELSIAINSRYDPSGANAAKSDLRSLGSAAGKIGTQFAGLQSGLTKAFKVGGTAAIAGVTALSAAITGVAVSGTKMAMDLESQISGIAAVLGESTSAVAPLKDLITDLGLDPNLIVNTEQAADAIEMLARNGLNMSQIMDGAAKSTILLANSTGGSFSTSADIATDALAQFNMQVSEMDGAVNQIVGVVNNSKFSLDDYGLAIAQAGGVAGAVGVEFEDFNTTIAAISPLFASGSDAGTSFKTFLQRLNADTKPAKTAMKQLGIITEDGSNRFFDAAGNLKSMNDIAVILNESLSGLSEEQSSLALQTIFGTDAIRAAVGVAEKGAVAYATAAEASAALGISISELEKYAEGGITSFEALQATIGKTDALEAARTRMDNLKGAFEIFSGVVDTIKLQIGDAFIPLVREGVEGLTQLLLNNQDAIIGFFQGITDFVSAGVGGELFTVFEDGSSVLESVLEKFGLTEERARALATTLINIRSDGLFAQFEDGSSNLESLAKWFGMTEEEARPLAQTIISVKDAVVDAVGPIRDFIAEWVKLEDVIVAVGIVAAGALWGMAAAALPMVATFAGLVAAAAGLRIAWETNFADIQGLVGELGAELGTLYNAAVEAWTSGDWSEVRTSLNNLATIVGNWAANDLRNALRKNEWWREIEETIYVMGWNIRLTLYKIEKFFTDTWDAIRTQAEAAWGVLRDTATTIWNSIKDHVIEPIETAYTTLEEKWINIRAGAVEAWAILASAATTAWGWIKDNIITPVSEAYDTLSVWWNDIRAGAVEAWALLASSATTAWGWVKDNIIAPVSVAYDDLSTWWANISAGAVEAWALLSSSATTAWGFVKDNIIAPVSQAYNDLSTWWENISAGAVEAWAILAGSATTAWGFVKDNIIAPVTGVMESLGTLWGQISTAALSAWAGLRANATLFWNAIKDGITGIVQLLQDTLGPIWTAIQSAATTVFGAIQAAMDMLVTAKDNVVTAFTNLKTFIGGLTFNNPFGGLLGWIQDIVGAARNAAAALAGLTGAGGGGSNIGTIQAQIGSGTSVYEYNIPRAMATPRMMAIPAASRMAAAPMQLSYAPASQGRAAGRGEPTVVQYNTFNVSSELDVRRVALQVTDEIKRRQR